MPRRSLRGIALIYVALIFAALLAVRGANYAIAHRALGIEVDRRLVLSEQVGASVNGRFNTAR